MRARPLLVPIRAHAHLPRTARPAREHQSRTATEEREGAEGGERRDDHEHTCAPWRAGA